MTTEHQTTELSFADQLVAHGLLLRSEVNGIYGRGAIFEDLITRLENLITKFGRDNGTEVLRFPPVLSRRVVEKSGYMKSFPHLLGSVSSFMGNHEQHQELLDAINCGHEWNTFLGQSDVVLTPAACYCVYPHVAGTLPEAGRLVEVSSYCFRHEPSEEPSRMQAFRMREFVRVGEADEVYAWRNAWMERGKEFLQLLGFTPVLAPANDMFFGPGGRLLKASQRDQGLKYELLVPLETPEKMISVMSFNYHQDHFGSVHEIRTSTNEVAHTACTGFGLERIVLALFAREGFDISKWGAQVREALGL